MLAEPIAVVCLRRVGQVPPPIAGSVLQPCSRCRWQCWAAPSAVALLRQEPHATIWCMHCAAGTRPMRLMTSELQLAEFGQLEPLARANAEQLGVEVWRPGKVGQA